MTGKPTEEQIAFINKCREKIRNGSGLTASDWGKFDSLEKRFFPAAYNLRKDESERNWCLKHARKLSLEDLQALIAEKSLGLNSTCAVSKELVVYDDLAKSIDGIIRLNVRTRLSRNKTRNYGIYMHQGVENATEKIIKLIKAKLNDFNP